MKHRKVEGLDKRLAEAIFNCPYGPLEIERRTGIHHSHISQYCTGQLGPSVYSLGVLAKICGVTTDWLIYGKKEQENEK